MRWLRGACACAHLACSKWVALAIARGRSVFWNLSSEARAMPRCSSACAARAVARPHSSACAGRGARNPTPPACVARGVRSQRARRRLARPGPPARGAAARTLRRSSTSVLASLVAARCFSSTATLSAARASLLCCSSAGRAGRGTGERHRGQAAGRRHHPGEGCSRDPLAALTRAELLQEGVPLGHEVLVLAAHLLGGGQEGSHARVAGSAQERVRPAAAVARVCHARRGTSRSPALCVPPGQRSTGLGTRA